MGENSHEHGKMDISVQEKAFDTFIKFVTNGIIIIVVFLILLYAING